EISAPGGTRTHTPRFKRPLLRRLSFEGVQCGGTELNRRLRVGMASGSRYPTAANSVGPERFELSPPGLKVRCAAVTPRSRIGSWQAFKAHQCDHANSPIQVVRGGIAPASGDVSDRHASVTTPDQSVARRGVEPLPPA